MKRTASIILSLILILGVFSACSKSEDENSTEKNDEIKITVDTHYADADASAVRAYEKLCNAVIAGEKEVKFNTALFDDVNQLFYTCFPLYPLVESINILPDSSGVSITYKNSDDDHLILVSQFFDKIEEIKTACDFGDVSTDKYIFNIYTYITKNITVDNSIVTAFDTVMQGKGYSASICSMFEYLILQGGGKASHIISSSAGIISMAEFKGQWYYFNPALDIEKNQGKALTGFAMNGSRVSFSEFFYTDEKPVDAVEDDTFDALKNSVSYEFDGNKVNVTCSGSKSLVLELN